MLGGPVLPRSAHERVVVRRRRRLELDRFVAPDEPLVRSLSAAERQQRPFSKPRHSEVHLRISLEDLPPHRLGTGRASKYYEPRRVLPLQPSSQPERRQQLRT